MKKLVTRKRQVEQAWTAAVTECDSCHTEVQTSKDPVWAGGDPGEGFPSAPAGWVIITDGTRVSDLCAACVVALKIPLLSPPEMKTSTAIETERPKML